MRIGKNITREFGIFRFQMKSIRTVFAVPLIVLFLLIPLLLMLTMGKYQDISYVKENFTLLGQTLVPVFSIWWLCFAFIELIEGEGNELHYVTHRMKDNLVLLWLGFYLACVVLGSAITGIWIEDILLESVRLVICSCFYVALAYAVMFLCNSMTATFLAVMIYWLASIFGNNIPIDLLNCYDTRPMTVEMIREKYIYILLAAIVLYAVGYITNKRRQKFEA